MTMKFARQQLIAMKVLQRQVRQSIGLPEEQKLFERITVVCQQEGVSLEEARRFYFSLKDKVHIEEVFTDEDVIEEASTGRR